MCVFLFKQKTAYEMRISDWSSDVCSSDLRVGIAVFAAFRATALILALFLYGYRRALILVNPVRQLRLVARGTQRERPEERRVGQERVRTFRSMWVTYH